LHYWLSISRIASPRGFPEASGLGSGAENAEQFKLIDHRQCLCAEPVIPQEEF